MAGSASGALKALSNGAKGLGPSLKGLTSSFKGLGPSLKGLTSSLKGLGNKINPQTLIDLASIGALGNIDSAQQQHEEIQMPVHETINAPIVPQQNSKCLACSTLRKKKKSGQSLSSDEKKIEDEICKACIEFCILIDKDKDLTNYHLCELVQALSS